MGKCEIVLPAVIRIKWLITEMQLTFQNLKLARKRCTHINRLPHSLYVKIITSKTHNIQKVVPCLQFHYLLIRVSKEQSLLHKCKFIVFFLFREEEIRILVRYSVRSVVSIAVESIT